MESSPIFTKTYELIVWLNPLLTRFPKDQRFRMTKRIEDSLFTFHENLLWAAQHKERHAYLLEADHELEKMRVYLRLSMDMGWIKFEQYERVGKMLTEIGKLLGGWIKADIA
jgi:four helix bundle protein